MRGRKLTIWILSQVVNYLLRLWSQWRALGSVRHVWYRVSNVVLRSAWPREHGSHGFLLASLLDSEKDLT